MRLVVEVRVDGFGPRLAGERGERLARGTFPEEEPRALRRQVRLQLAEALREEPQPGRGEVLRQVVVVEDEDRDDAVVRAQGRVEREVVVEAEVPSEPDDRGGHAARLRR